MARRIDYSARYQHSPEQVYAALADRSYWEARVEEMRKHSENHVEHFEVTDSGNRSRAPPHSSAHGFCLTSLRQ